MKRFLLTLAVTGGLLTGSASAADLTPTAVPAAPVVEAEPNNTAATGQALTSGQRVRGTILAFNDVGLDPDHYRIAAQAGDRLSATLMTATALGASPTLTLLAPDGTTTIEADSDNGEIGFNTSSLATVPLPQTGTYVLRVTRGSADIIAPYDLYATVNSGAPVAEAEPNNTPAQANPLGALVSGSYAAGSGENDSFKVDLQAGDTIFLSLDLDPQRGGNSLLDGRLTLSGDQGTIVQVDDFGTSDPNPSEAIVATVGQTGTYVARIDGAGNGPYRLSATVIPRQTPACRSYTGSAVGVGEGTTEVPIAVSDAAEIKRLLLTFDITHSRLEDLDVSLRSPTGVEVGLFADIAPGIAIPTRHAATYSAFAAAPLGSALAGLSILPQQPHRLEWFDGTEAAGTWRIVIRDDTANGSSGSVVPPTLVLCPQDAPGPSQEIFSAGFESGDDGFTHSGTADEWARGTPATAGTTTSSPVAGLAVCGEGTKCWKTDLNGTYNTNSAQTLLSPPISLVGRTGRISAAWRQWFQLELARFDYARVSVEEAGGANPRTLWEWDGPTMTNTFIGLGQAVHVPSAAGWARRVGDLSAYAGKIVQLRFVLVSDSSTEYAGLAIDDVKVFQPTGTVTVDRAGSGSGTVTSSVGGISCGATCTTSALPLDTPITLTATPASGSTFSGFTGAGCSGSGTTCNVTFDQSRTVTATFDQPAPPPEPTPTPDPGAGPTPDPGGTPLPDPTPFPDGGFDSDTIRPALSIRLTRGKLTPKKRARVTVTLSETASVGGSLSIRTCTRKKGARKRTCRITRKSINLGTRRQGSSTANITLKGLKPGTYTLSLSALDPSGNRSSVRTLKLKVVRR